nr:MAG TPA: hypothetical protein [Caudoviricetes sp.]
MVLAIDVFFIHPQPVRHLAARQAIELRAVKEDTALARDSKDTIFLTERTEISLVKHIVSEILDIHIIYLFLCY